MVQERGFCLLTQADVASQSLLAVVRGFHYQLKALRLHKEMGIVRVKISPVCVNSWRCTCQATCLPILSVICLATAPAVAGTHPLMAFLRT